MTFDLISGLHMQIQTWHPPLRLCIHGKYYVKSGLTNVLENANKTKNMHLFSIRIANYYQCRLLITFANSLYPDQVRQNIGLDLDPYCFPLVFLKEFLKNSADDKKKHAKFTQSRTNLLQAKNVAVENYRLLLTCGSAVAQW